MTPPGSSTPWQGHKGWSRISLALPSQTTPYPHPSLWWAAEGRNSCCASAGAKSSQCIRISTMSPLDLCEHTSAPNIAQLTSRHRPRPENPHCSPSRVLCVWINRKGQGPICFDPLFPFEVHSPNLSDNLPWVWNANYKQEIWII